MKYNTCHIYRIRCQVDRWTTKLSLRIGKSIIKTVVQFADKGSVCHCGNMGGVSRKIVLAAKVFRVATGINPVISVALATVGSVVDIASLIYSSYKIHKKSDSSAAKELAKVRDQLEESRKQLINMKEYLSDIPNSM